MRHEPEIEPERLEPGRGARNRGLGIPGFRDHHADSHTLLHQLPLGEVRRRDDREVVRRHVQAEPVQSGDVGGVLLEPDMVRARKPFRRIERAELGEIAPRREKARFGAAQLSRDQFGIGRARRADRDVGLAPAQIAHAVGGDDLDAQTRMGAPQGEKHRAERKGGADLARRNSHRAFDRLRAP